MNRGTSLARVPQRLLPSSGAAGGVSGLASDSSLDSELEGLSLRPPQHHQEYLRSASGPAAPSAVPPPVLPQEAGGGAVHRSSTAPVHKSVGQVAPVTIHVDARWQEQPPPWSNRAAAASLAAAAAPPAEQQKQQAAQPPLAAQRMGSQGLSQAGSGPAPISPSSTASGSFQRSASNSAAGSSTAKPTAGFQPSAPSNSSGRSSPMRSASPDTNYGEDDFEAEDSCLHSHWHGSPAAASAFSTAAIARSNGNGRAGECAPSRSPSAKAPSRSTSCLGYLASTATVEAKRAAPEAVAAPRAALRSGSRPWSASPTKQQHMSARPGSSRPPLEARVGLQMGQDPADWTVGAVCDWLELIGLGQYRRRFVHNAVSGALLLKLSSEELKVEVGVGPLGHREALLTAINDLEQYWQQQQEARRQAGAAPDDGEWEGASTHGGSVGAGSRPGSPPPNFADYSMQRAYAQRAKLLRELGKAEGREAHRKKAAEQALRVVDQATDEIRKLQASICELDKDMGWQGAADQQFDPVDVHGAVAWQPAGKQRATARPGSGSPARHGDSGGGNGARGGSPMSRISRRIMEGQRGGGGGNDGFLDRLSSDIEARQAKAAEAARRAGRFMGGSAQQAEREQESRDLRFVREMIEGKSTELAEMLGSSDARQVAEACNDVAEMYQREFSLSDEAVAAVKKLGSPGRKAAKLAGALRSSQFMQRLQRDLATREGRLQQLQDKFYKLDRGYTAEQQEKADLAAAQAHFGLLGWTAADLDVAAGDSSAGSDDMLNRLLRRVVAVQEARQRGKGGVDWEQPEWKRDGLEEKQSEHTVALSAALAEQKALAEAAVEAARVKRHHLGSPTHCKELPQPGPHLLDTVALLAACRPDEVALLEGLSGYRKLLMAWRAVRAQQFIAFTRRDLDQRQAKAAALAKQLYPDTTKVLPKEEFDQFFDRLMSDTNRRVQNREELAEKAKSDALAKLMKSAPPPPSYQRHQRPASAQR